MSAAAHVHEGRHRGLGPLIPFEEARRRLMALAAPIRRTGRVRVGEAAGRVAASDVRAGIDVPTADRASMDGYAVRAADTAGASEPHPRALRCVGAVFAGTVSRKRVEPGTCVQVATGGTLPPGADAVAMVETTEREGDEIRVRVPVRPGQHVSARGEDIRKGVVVVHAGDVLTPARVGALTAVGATSVSVYGRPRVGILTTGTEVVAPGARLRPGQVYDINGFTIAAVARAAGGEPEMVGRVRDDPVALARAVRASLTRDIVVVSGGSSVGERDLLAEVLADMGEIVFHGVAIKPGRPTLLARVRGKPVLGMPGFATSCLSNAYVLLAPALRAMARLPPQPPRSVDVPLAAAIDSPKGRTEFHTVRIEGGRAVPAFKESSAITSMANADGYIEIPAAAERVAEGETVRVVLF